MNLLYKPDFEDTQRRWDAHWAGQIVDRPTVAIVAPREGAEPVERPHWRLNAWEDDFNAVLDRFEQYCATHVFLGEAIPCLRPGWGPDQFTVFLGGSLTRSAPEHGTSWVDPFVDDWDAALPFELDPENPWFKGLLERMRAIAERGEGKFLAHMIDIHANGDALSAMRGMQAFIFDMIDRPETVDRAMRSIRKIFHQVYDAFYKAGAMDERGSIMSDFYARGRFYLSSCDAIAVMDPAMFRRFVLPAIEDEVAAMDHSIFHLDGPDAVKHLDDLMSLEKLDGIQVVPGAGGRPYLDCIDIFRKVQKAGKGLHLNCIPEQARTLHKQLKPEGCFYDMRCESEAEGRELLEWFVKNT